MMSLSCSNKFDYILDCCSILLNAPTFLQFWEAYVLLTKGCLNMSQTAGLHIKQIYTHLYFILILRRLFCQLRLLATRQFEVNTQTATATVSVTVTRNVHEPRFSQSEYRLDKLSEKTPAGSPLLQVQATDADEVRVSAPTSSHSATSSHVTSVGK